MNVYHQGGQLILTEKLRAFISKRRIIISNKKQVFLEHKYEEAAKHRDSEKKINELILREFRVDSDFFVRKPDDDVFKIIDLYEDKDKDFGPAISKLDKSDFVRFKLTKVLNDCVNKNLTVTELKDHLKNLLSELENIS
jgi:hypothetical protein